MLLAKENNALFVCANPAAMEYKANAYGIEKGIEFISYHDFITNFYDNRKYVVDELENFIQATMGQNTLIGYTISKE